MADPLYRQIAQDLMHKIQSGQLPPGAKLPNEVEFREEYDASRNTIRDAIKWLTIRRLVETRPGQGTFVVQKIEPFVTTLSDDRDPDTGMAGGEGVAAFAEIKERQRQKKDQERLERLQARQRDSDAGELEPAEDDSPDDSPGAEPTLSTPTVEVKGAPDYVAERLRIDTGDEVVVRHQRFYIGRTPWSLQTTFYPMDLVDRGATQLMRARDITEGTVKYLNDALGLQQCGSRLRILVRAPNEIEARFFGLPDDGRVPVVSLIRTGYEIRPEEGPYPFRVTFTVLPADRNQFVINSKQVPEELASPARDQ
jgi:GntR family transcriptional regulator